jgi:hypothetical protein
MLASTVFSRVPKTVTGAPYFWVTGSAVQISLSLPDQPEFP